MKRFCAAILTLSLLAAALSGCGAAQSAPETTAAQTTFPTETAAPETNRPGDPAHGHCRCCARTKGQPV